MIPMGRTMMQEVVMNRVLAAIGGAALAVLGALRLRRRRKAAAGPRNSDGGGLAGVREPRRPLPTTLSSAGAGHPGD